MIELLISVRNMVLCIFSAFMETTNTFFSGNIAYTAVFLISFLMLFSKKERLQRGTPLFLPFTLLSLVFLIYNPLLKHFISDIPTSNELVFARFWLLCPIWLIVAYSCARICSSFKHKAVNYVGVACITCVLVIFGSTISKNHMYIETQDIYKVNQDAVAISDKVLSLSGGNPTSLYILVPSTGGPLENFVNGGSIHSGINQYSAYIDIHADAFTETDWNDCFVSDLMPDGITPTENYIEYFFTFAKNELESEYVAFPDDPIVNERIARLGYPLVGQAGGYGIYLPDRDQ